MSFAITPLGKEIPPASEAPKIYSEAFKHSIVDSSYQPETSLLSMVDGAPRLGEYYRCFLGADEEPTPFSPDNTGTYQSYTRIKRTVIKQEGDGAFNFNPDNAESTKVYNGWAISKLAPVRHDVVIFDIGDGLAGLFAVTEQPEPRNITANKMFYITYQFLCILTKDIYDILNGRVVEEKVYDRDAALHSGADVISPEAYDIGQKLSRWKATIANYVMREFYWNPEKTIVYDAANDEKVYDQYLVSFIRAVLPPELQTTYPFINEFSVQYGGLDKGYHGTINIWEVLLRGDFNLLKICDNKAAMIQTTRLANTRLYGNLRSSKIMWFICTNPEDYKEYKEYFNMDGFPILLPSTEKNFSGYVFSDAFFTGVSDDPFEQLVFAILRDKVVDKKKLLAYCEGYFDLDKNQQLYHGAILMLLLEVSRKLGDPL
jgi:hypothetical protein